MRPRRLLAWIQTLPTTTFEGKVFTTATLVFGIFSVASGGNLKLLVLAAMIAIAFVSCIASARNLSGITFTRELPPRVRAGDEFEVRLAVTNHRRLTPLLAVTVIDAIQSRGATADTPCVIERVPPGGTLTVTYRARIAMRGFYRIRPALFRTRFPFGLFEKRTVLEHASDILVTPKPAKVDPAVVDGAGDRNQRDVGALRPDRGGEEFRGLREYRPGDPVRRVAWKATARRGELVVRVLDRRRSERTLIVLDMLSGPGTRPTNETAIRLAVGVAERVRRSRRPTSIAYFGPSFTYITRIEAGAGRDAMLESLAQAQADESRGLAELVARLDPRVVRAARVVVVSGATPRVRAAAEETLRRWGGDPVSIVASRLRPAGRALDVA